MPVSPRQLNAGAGDRRQRLGTQPFAGRFGERDAHSGTASLGADGGAFFIHGDHSGEQRVEHGGCDDRDGQQLYPQGEWFKHHGAGENTEVAVLACFLKGYERLVDIVGDGVDTVSVVLAVAEELLGILALDVTPE